MKAFCTLFDSRYLSRGLAMYESLTTQTPDSHLYIFAFDDIALDVLRSLDLPSATIVAQADFEDAELLRVKATRSAVEYCWTCTPSVVRYCIRTFGLGMCTYVDADTWFFADCTPLLDEMGKADAMIIEHRYTPEHDRAATSGIYNVQFMPFRATPRGIEILEWWRDACLEACELNVEKGLCGDQKYLDDWPQRFAGDVHVLQHLGGGVAPWNVQQYTFSESDGKVKGRRLTDNTSFNLIFYHFHAMKVMDNGLVYPTNAAYTFDTSVIRCIYMPYFSRLASIAGRLQARGITLDPHGSQSAPDEIEVTWLQRLAKLVGWPPSMPKADAQGNANHAVSFERVLKFSPFRTAPAAAAPSF